MLSTTTVAEEFAVLVVLCAPLLFTPQDESKNTTAVDSNMLKFFMEQKYLFCLASALSLCDPCRADRVGGTQWAFY